MIVTQYPYLNKKKFDIKNTARGNQRVTTYCSQLSLTRRKPFKSPLKKTQYNAAITVQRFRSPQPQGLLKQEVMFHSLHTHS